MITVYIIRYDNLSSKMIKLLGIIILIAVFPVVAQPPNHTRTLPARPDFDNNGLVNVDDYRLFANAFGTKKARFDLDGNGRVDFEDLFLFADRVEVDVGQTEILFSAVDPELPYRITSDRGSQKTRVELPDYRVTVSRGSPFGITSLRLSGQPVDFAHDELPLSDWEWLWFDHPRRSGRAQTKLLQVDWGVPAVTRQSDRLILMYRIPDVIFHGLDLRVLFNFDAMGSRFSVGYQIENRSGELLRNAYVMIGFPGFSNHQRVTEVSDALSSRKPRAPYASFLEEATDVNLAEYSLLRHDLFVGQGKVLGAKGGVAIDIDRKRYGLEAFYFADTALSRAYSAHTNKPGYLTSHLYVTLGDIRDGWVRSVTVNYDLTKKLLDSSSVGEK